jgi:hypothetical protein
MLSLRIHHDHKFVTVIQDVQLHDREYLKIVRKWGDRLFSFFNYNSASVKYIPGEFVSAPPWLAKLGYHLTVFDSFDALCWLVSGQIDSSKYTIWIDSSKYTIWKAEARNQVSLPPFLHTSGLRDKQILRYSEYSWPRGTCMFKEVKLTDQVI